MDNRHIFQPAGQLRMQSNGSLIFLSSSTLRDEQTAQQKQQTSATEVHRLLSLLIPSHKEMGQKTTPSLNRCRSIGQVLNIQRLGKQKRSSLVSKELQQVWPFAINKFGSWRSSTRSHHLPHASLLSLFSALSVFFFLSFFRRQKFCRQNYVQLDVKYVHYRGTHDLLVFQTEEPRKKSRTLQCTRTYQEGDKQDGHEEKRRKKILMKETEDFEEGVELAKIPRRHAPIPVIACQEILEIGALEQHCPLDGFSYSPLTYFFPFSSRETGGMRAFPARIPPGGPLLFFFFYCS